ncbi:MAG: 4Fe-4S binding protein [Candidatus Methanofastidiosia archaeon]|jgi:Fe-S-cluster-containing hydrogenase component 2
MVHYSTGCIGCRICEIVCSLSLFGEIDPQKSAIKIISQESSSNYTIAVCNQCGECIAHCPETALYYDNSTVKIDAALCTGCYTCVDICPLQAFFIHPHVKEPIKCIQCGTCVTACPVDVLQV